MADRWFATMAVLAVWTAPAWAGAEAFFEQTSHDFGSVPRGPLLTHYYRFTNTGATPVHISSVRVSCGCVAASAVQTEVAPGQSTAIYATMDTRRFAGAKTVTIFVTFDRPRWEEVRLTVTAYGRDDLALDPETLTFGTVTRGAVGNARMTVTLRQPNWAVTAATSDSPFVVPAIKELRRTQFEVVYEIGGTLKPGLPVGSWVTDVHLTTNSPAAPTIRVPASVDITPTLSVSPAELSLGTVSVGQPSEHKFIVKGNQPFRIKEVQGTDANLTVSEPSAEPKAVHVVTVKFDPKAAGALSRKLRIVTDLPDEGVAEVAVKGSAVERDTAKATKP